ncbi:MAG: FAD-dependent oxidoreductase [Eubacteriaceae bacterium]
MKKYPHLFSPYRIKNVTFRNRIFATPTGMTYPDEYTGEPDFKTVLFYEKKARGGAASVTLGETKINDVDCVRRPNVDRIRPDFARMILPKKSWVKVTDAIKRHGAVPSIQLSHGGMFSEPVFINGNQPIGPVDMVKENGTVVRGMNEDDMKRIANDFAEAAWCAQDAGFQEVMLHCGHGWLIGQFLSPHWNTRTDEYGGPIENRAKFPLMVINAVREKVGENFIIEIRISGDEHQENGWPIEDVIKFAHMVEGKVDLIHISAGDYHNSDQYCFSTVFMPHNCNVHVAEALKKGGVKTPLVTVGSINDPEEMERLIAEGITDFVAIGRGILADSDLPKKIQLGKEDDIRPCVRCCNCMGGLYDGYYQCDVNPVAGQEAYLLRTLDVEESKRVLVVGGGPGGMVAALTAASRGHKVTLVEKNDKLGGTLQFSDIDSHKQDLRNYKDYLIHQVEKHGVDIRLNTEANIALLEELQPQSIIVATGAQPRVLKTKGAEKACHAIDAYYSPEKIGNKVVMIGGGLIGCEVALHLAELGKDVTVIEIIDELAKDANIIHKASLVETMEMMKDLVHGVTKAQAKEITYAGVTYVDQDGNEQFLEADTVLYAIGMLPNDDIVEQLRAWDGWETFVPIGDCTGASIIRKAIHDGYHAAIDIV